MAMHRRKVLKGLGAAAAGLAVVKAPYVHAQTGPIRVGFLTVKTGPLASGGLQMEQGLLTFLKDRKNMLGNRPVDWQALVDDYARIRQLIAETIAGFADFDRRLRNPGGFHLGNSAAERRWKTATGRANFVAHALPEDLFGEALEGAQPDLILQTLRSHDQYNTTVYGLDDRYRGVKGQRRVVFAHVEDIRRLGFEPGQKVDIESLWNDGIERRVRNFTLLAFDIPPGQAAAYYPETNPLVPLASVGIGSHTPTSKSVAIKLHAAQPEPVIA